MTLNSVSNEKPLKISSRRVKNCPAFSRSWRNICWMDTIKLQHRSYREWIAGMQDWSRGDKSGQKVPKELLHVLLLLLLLFKKESCKHEQGCLWNDPTFSCIFFKSIIYICMYVCMYLFFWQLCAEAWCGISVPTPGIEPRPQRLKYQVLTTRPPVNSLCDAFILD